MNERSDQVIQKGGTDIASEYMKRGSALLVIRKMQSKTT